MKKIYIAAISLLALLLVTSCSNDEIDIEKVGRKYDLTFNVSTQDIFEKFDLTNSVRDNYLRDGSRAVGVYTFLYNQNGDLLQKDQIVLPTYNIATKTYSKLVEGKYTFVCVETLVNPDVDNTSEDWSIEGEDKLSTLKLKAEGVLGWASILGTSTQVVDLSRSTEISVTPEAVGARVNLYCYNFGTGTPPMAKLTAQLAPMTPTPTQVALWIS